MSSDFENLPEVLYAQVDTAEVETSIFAMYEGITNTTLYPGDPVRLFLSTLAAIIAQQNAITDYTAKQNLLRYAKGNYLEHIGSLLDVYRLDALPAKTVLRFTLAESRPFAVAIPAGTRATHDGKIFFATDKMFSIPPGFLEGEAAATCLTYGSDGNDLAIGQVGTLVDSVPYVKKVENINNTAGGSDVEDDEALRTRIRLAPEQFTTAGSELAYIFWAFSAHSNIDDVAVISPLPGIVNVFMMLKGGNIPDADGVEINAVRNILNEKKRRPLTDFVVVLPANHEPLDYSFKWYITSEQGVFYNEIKNRIDSAVKEYETWQTGRIGRDIVPDHLIRLCLAAGAKRIEIEGLRFTRIDTSSVANFVPNPDRIQFGGVENE
jgi:phage-related baseplate assembly protein